MPRKNIILLILLIIVSALSACVSAETKPNLPASDSLGANYLTAEPVESQEKLMEEAVYSCTLSVRCDTILSNLSSLNPEKSELVPEDGLIFYAQEAEFYEGDSVFDLLQRELKQAKIAMDFANSPIYNSAYLKGINNLYELDCGELSGWLYKVNGLFPSYGCSRYQLKPGDIVEIVYTCDLGRDVGRGD